MVGLDGWLLSSEAAYQIGISISCLNRRALRGSIRTRRVGRIRLYNEEDVRQIKAVKVMMERRAAGLVTDGREVK
jgi:hypothetical protein